jgi:hypothetical protein
MLRSQTPTGWFLITHPHHAQLAGSFAAHWGNDTFVRYEPRKEVLNGVATHDNGWIERDKKPLVYSDGTPSAFGTHLVGKYSAFENIDLADYLGVRARATAVVAEENPYGAILISMHTCNLLGVHADRSTIKPSELPLLDSFLEWQKTYQEYLRQRLVVSGAFAPEFLTPEALHARFVLLQACDNLSLLTCVNYRETIPLQHSHPRHDGTKTPINFIPLGEGRFRLDPYPLDQDELTFHIAARPVKGQSFGSQPELQATYDASSDEKISITIVR